MKIILFAGNVHFMDKALGEKRANPNIFLDFSPETSPSEDDKKRMRVLKQIVNNYGSPKNKSCRELFITVRCMNTCPSIFGGIRLSDKSSFLQDMSALFGRDNVHVKITISGLTCSTSCGNFGGGENSSLSYEGKICSKEMTVMDSSYITCEDDSIQFPSQHWQNIFYQNADQHVSYNHNQSRIHSHLMIGVTINTSGLDLKESNTITATATPKLYMKMLHDEIHCDAEITANNGTPVKCHRAVLSSCSTVLETMFQVPMVEASTHKLELKDMTEEAVKAFLAFIYYLCDEEPYKDCGIAYELLNAGHKYNVVPDLEGAMIKLMLGKEAYWFDVNVAVDIFSLARNIPAGEELKMKCVGVLKEKLCQLADSESYNLLFQKDPSAAKELCKLAFVTSS